MDESILSGEEGIQIPRPFDSNGTPWDSRTDVKVMRLIQESKLPLRFIIECEHHLDARRWLQLITYLEKIKPQAVKPEKLDEALALSESALYQN